MKNLILALVVLCGQSAFANSSYVPGTFLAEATAQNKMNPSHTDQDFSQHIDHLLAVQTNSLEKISSDHPRLSLTQILTSFSISKTGLFGLSTLSTSSATTLFWNKKISAAKKDEEANTIAMSEDDDELSLQMKVDDLTDYLVRENKVKEGTKLRENLERIIRRGHEVFNDIGNLETPNWKVSGYRLDLSISASGAVAPFTKVGESVRLWLEWTKASHPKLTSTPSTKISRFVSKVLNDTEIATSKWDMPNFELQNLYVGLGEDLKAGLFGFGPSSFGFVGYVKFAKKPKPTATELTTAESEDEYPVIQNLSVNKSRPSLVSISGQKIRKGIEKSIKFAEFFTKKAELIQSPHWELSTVREIATIGKSGFFGLSGLTTKGVFIFMFNRKKPVVAETKTKTETSLTLMRLSFVTMLGYNIPEIANFELRPNVELFWK